MGILRSNFSQYWNQVTPENAGKWGSVEGSRDSYNWTPLDNIYNYSISNGFPYKHHCLVWGQQQPSWITSIDSAAQRAEVEEWIQLVGARYTSMSFVDVVNEPFHAPPSYANALGGAGKTGWDWVITAFTWARQYCIKGVKLHLNEYNILHDNAATDNYLRLIDTLRVRGLIDGIGIQGHYFEFKSAAGSTPAYAYSVSTIRANLERLTATGLPVYISEFDINEANDNTQLQNYQTYFSLFWENPGVKGITLWGYVQGDIWKQNAYLVRADGSERPALPWLRTYTSLPIPPVLASPVSTSGEPRNPRLVWHPSAAAKSYHVQVALNGAFSSPIVDTTVVDTLLQSDLLAANTRHYWHVRASNDSGASSYSATAVFVTGDQTLDVEEATVLPAEYALHQNFPNPFNPSTVVRFQLPVASEARLVVYDILGREVATLLNGRKEAGSHQVAFDATRLTSGVYLYRLTAGPYVLTRKMNVMK